MGKMLHSSSNSAVPKVIEMAVNEDDYWVLTSPSPPRFNPLVPLSVLKICVSESYVYWVDRAKRLRV